MVRQMDEHEQRSMMLKMLQNAPDWVTSEVIEANTWMNQWGVFEAAMHLVKQGHPVCVQHLESGWLNWTESEAEVEYRLAKTPQDLDQLREMVGDQQAYLCRIKVGIEKALERFAPATTTSRLNGT